MRRAQLPSSFDVEVLALGPGGCGTGLTPDGLPLQVKPGPPGALLRVAPAGFRKEIWHARRLELLRPPPGHQVPPCRAFGVCGGCVLQELNLETQRDHKHRFALQQVADRCGWTLPELHRRVHIHPVRGTSEPFHYRNKIELTFGASRFISDGELQAGGVIDGRYLGFHAPTRFDRVADVDRCWLVGTALNQLVAALRLEVLERSPLPLWDPRFHTGFWRHAVLRQARATGEVLVGLYTASASHQERREAERVAAALLETRLESSARLCGVVWIENDRVADVAQGTASQVWGRDWIEERLGDSRFRLSLPSFFQTSSGGAAVLYDTLKEALGRPRRYLFDLYCGTGAIGIYLRDFAAEIVGVEESEAAVADARANAERNGVQHAQYLAARLEDVLPVLDRDLRGAAVVVDPPRAGLHRKVAELLAAREAEVLVYVACNPGSLARDAVVLEAGGWQLEALWTVDLFPQTGHIELVGRFIRREAG